MDFYTLVCGPLENDIKFKNTVKSIMDFAGEQTYCKEFAKKEPYYQIRADIEYQFAHPVARDKYNVLCNLETMVDYLPPKIKKIVRKYFETQMTLYCQGLRGFSKEIPDYPYKSDNIVDLLEEVETVDKEKKNSFMLEFSPKPFYFAKWYSGHLNQVYLPRTDVWEDKNGNRECMCVHMCKKFLTYPAGSDGMTCIPENAKCDDTGRRCSGSCIFRNGINTGITKDLLDNKYIIDAETKCR